MRRSHLKVLFNISKEVIVIQISNVSSNLKEYYSSGAIETAGDSLKKIYKYDLNRMKIDQLNRSRK